MLLILHFYTRFCSLSLMSAEEKPSGQLVIYLKIQYNKGRILDTLQLGFAANGYFKNTRGAFSILQVYRII